ncbi:MFS transporter [Pusillimonas sp. CC-YST705]|uniref:MFS transporter n=1 Tax=Mesopusillimonas faecipullorum TaxID=2755040 RepID=A0ABS8CFJ4_9BURK|nr:MFS transporter [Mesopusillimonas faecipullorum]MCB5364812.1 MFS transporter [Mesopusillimonas faecipullorum]
MTRSPTETSPPAATRLSYAWKVLGLLLIAANLRAALTAVPPMLNDIAEAFSLSTTALGVLTAAPVFLFALTSPLATRLARARGLEQALGIATLALIAGLLLRSSGSLAALFAGTIAIAIGIGIGNVLAPGLVKRDFPLDKGTLTASYAVLIGITAALSAAVAVPIAHGLKLGWQMALASSLTLAIPAALYWLPRCKYSRGASGSSDAPQAAPLSRPLHRSALAWQVTFFLGLNSFIFFLIVGWLPAMLQQAHYSAQQAGSVHGLMLLSAAFPSLILIPLFRHLRDQRLLASATSLGMLVGCLGIWLWPHWALLWSIIFGVSAGSGFVVSLSLIPLRTRTPLHTTQLSGMAQFLGYLMAAAGLLLTGWMRDVSGNWSSVLMLGVLCCVLMAALGYMAGRNIYLK